MLRRVHEERAVGLHYGQRALCIGALKPLNYVGTSEHSRHMETPEIFSRRTVEEAREALLLGQPTARNHQP